MLALNLTPEQVAARPAVECAEIAYLVRAELARYQEQYEEMVAPYRALAIAAEERVMRAIREAGGTALPHDSLDVRIEQTSKRDKRLDVLAQLAGLVPADQLADAYFAKSVSHAARLSTETLAACAREGAEVVMDADLRKLDTLARKYGGDVAAIVAAGSPRVEVGAPKLTIEPRESALRRV